MRQYLKEYVDYVDKLLKNKKLDNKEEIINEHLIKISFFQHERLIHLLVTLFYAIFLLIMIGFSIYYKLLAIVVLILAIFLVFYVRHYFFLENNIQYLYKQYDLLKKK